MKRTVLIFGTLAFVLSACTQPYVERITPTNCACSDNWASPINNGKVTV